MPIERNYPSEQRCIPSVGDYRTASPQPATIEKPRIAQQLDHLEKVLAECHAIAANVEHAADRLLGPTPEDPNKQEGRAPANSVDQRFTDLIRVAEMLAQRISHASQRLNQAV